MYEWRIDKWRCKNLEVCTEKGWGISWKGNWSSRTPLRQTSPGGGGGGEGENEASLSLPCGRQKRSEFVYKNYKDSFSSWTIYFSVPNAD